MSHSTYSHLICCVPSGGLSHFKKDLAYSVVNEGLQQRCFLLRHVPSVVISEHARVPSDPGHGDLRVCAHFQSGHPQHRHSRNLLDFKAVGGLLGDSYRGDPRTQGRVDNFYLQALDRYKDVTYKEFHKYVASKMEAFYKRHGFPATKAAKVVQEPDESQGPELGAVVPVEGGSALNKSYAMSDSEDDEEEGGAGAAVGGAEPAAEPAAAAAAAETAAAANAGAA